MTDKLMHFLLIKLKVIAVALLLALFSFFLFSFNTSKRMADDIWKQLGMSKTQGMEGIKQSFVYGYLDVYSARNAKNIAIGDRAAVVKDLLAYTKQFVNSDAFRKEYASARAASKPIAPEAKVISKENIRKEKIAETEKSIKGAEKTSKEMGAEMEKALKPTIDLLKKDLEDYKSPNSKNVEMIYQNDLREQADRQRDYEERLVKWEKNNPVDCKVVIKQRLQKYIELASTVDFNAELKVVGKKKKFVNPQYEGKANDWKTIFRAGKEVYDVAKPFAEQWLKELEAGK